MTYPSVKFQNYKSKTAGGVGLTRHPLTLRVLGTNLVKDHQAMLQTKFQAPEPKSSGEEDF